MPRVGSSSSSTSGCVRIQRPKMTFCWLPPESVLILVCWLGVLIRMALIMLFVASAIFLSLRNGPFRYFFRLAMTVFARISRIPRMPVARRSSVTSAKPFLMDSRGVLLPTSLPFL